VTVQRNCASGLEALLAAQMRLRAGEGDVFLVGGAESMSNFPNTHGRQTMNNYYQHHVFFCTNQRPEGKTCCENYHASEVRLYLKDRVKALGLHGEGRVRVNVTGCMGRCDFGPVLVVYPEGVWYTFVDQEDIDEIVEKHLQGGQVVERLRIPEPE